MNRRQFLKSSAAATAATVSAGPMILGAQDKAGSKLPRVGAGEHTYECHHNWGKLPNGLEWQTTHNVAVDSQGLVYITHQGIGKKEIDTTFVFDPSGQFVRSFGKEWWGGGHGIDIRKDDSEEFLYLTNTWKSPKVVKATLKGEVVWKKERPEAKEYENPKATYNPTNVAFCPDGSFFVGDGYGSNYMLKYDKDGKLLKVFGGAGSEPGKFRTPHGNWVDTRDPAKPVLVVCDRANARLQTFTLDGDYISMTEKGTVLFPAHIDIRGDVMLVPDLHARISLFGKDNKPIVHLGDDDAWRERVVGSLGKKGMPAVRAQPKEWAPGKFVHPHDACFDKDGNIFVAEWVSTGRITLLKKVG
jgi:DNA-binding beta-propeller fold protein YncE